MMAFWTRLDGAEDWKIRQVGLRQRLECTTVQKVSSRIRIPSSNWAVSKEDSSIDKIASLDPLVFHRN